MDDEGVAYVVVWFSAGWDGCEAGWDGCEK